MSIRLRFTIWAAAIMLAIFLTLSFGLYYMMERNLQQEMDQRVASVWRTLISNPDLYVDRDTGELLTALENPEPFAAPGLYIQVLRATDLSLVAKTNNLGREVIPISPEHLERNRQGERIYYASFVGFFPAEDPQVTVLISIDEPPGGDINHFGGTAAAPVFARLAPTIMHELGMQPTVPTSACPPE